MNVRTNSFGELKLYYDTVLNTDTDSFVTSNDEPTPIDCVEEMVASLPPEFMDRSDLKILDPCCGNGNFHLVLHSLLNYPMVPI